MAVSVKCLQFQSTLLNCVCSNCMQAMPKPVAVHRFGTLDPLTGEDSDDDTAHFISAVCWKSDALTMLAANSQGTIKVLSLAP